MVNYRALSEPIPKESICRDLTDVLKEISGCICMFIFMIIVIIWIFYKTNL